MKLEEFFLNMRNHPILFLGTGFSLRYLEKSYTWRGLLEKIAIDLYEDKKNFLDLLSKATTNNKVSYETVAQLLEKDFENLSVDNPKFIEINDIFYENMDKEIKISKFKIYLCEILKNISEKSEMQDELSELKKIRKNIGAVITTNYDKLVENIFNFNPLIGNKILFSQPYGSVYKIHGCVDDYESIVITSSDYDKFDKKYELIKAQILSLFLHNPIIFIGYSLTDKNIVSILKTIFSYVDVNSAEAEKIRRNFLLVEYDKDNMNTDVIEHDIQIDEIGTIRINKIKTDNFSAIYQQISNLILHVSAMDIRKVQSVFHKITVGDGGISVSITDDIDNLDNNDMVLAIGSKSNIKYEFKNLDEIIRDYFDILDEENKGVIKVVNKHQNIIKQNRILPVFAFSSICSEINNIDELKELQRKKIQNNIDGAKFNTYNKENSKRESIREIEKENVTNHKKHCLIFWNFYHDHLTQDDVEEYLRKNLINEFNENPIKQLLCLYDFKKYGES